MLLTEKACVQNASTGHCVCDRKDRMCRRGATVPGRNDPLGNSIWGAKTPVVVADGASWVAWSWCLQPVCKTLTSAWLSLSSVCGGSPFNQSQGQTKHTSKPSGRGRFREPGSLSPGGVMNGQIGMPCVVALTQCWASLPCGGSRPA